MTMEQPKWYAPAAGVSRRRRLGPRAWPGDQFPPHSLVTKNRGRVASRRLVPWLAQVNLDVQEFPLHGRVQTVFFIQVGLEFGVIRKADEVMGGMAFFHEDEGRLRRLALPADVVGRDHAPFGPGLGDVDQAAR